MQTQSLPHPFDNLPSLSIKHLRWLREVALAFSAGCGSLRDVAEHLQRRVTRGDLCGECCPGISSICSLPAKLRDVLSAHYAKVVDPYHRVGKSGHVIGLSGDGLEVLRLIEEFLRDCPCKDCARAHELFKVALIVLDAAAKINTDLIRDNPPES